MSPVALSELDRRQAIRELINTEVTDILQQSGHTLAELGTDSSEAARRQPRNIVAFSTEMSERNVELRSYLHTHLYRHYRVTRMAVKAQRLVAALYSAYLEEPSQLPESTQVRLRDQDCRRAICDYVAGMTDRFALEEYRKLFDPEERT